MPARRRCLLLAAALLAAAPATADGAVRAAVKIQEVNGGARLALSLTGTRSLTPRQQPLAAIVVVGGRPLKLAKVPGSRASFRSARQAGGPAFRLRSLAGRSLNIRLRSRAGITIVRTRVPAVGAPQPTAPTPPPAQPNEPFHKPPRELQGNAAVESISRYLFNSELSDCPTGNFPSCNVENRYEHGPGGEFEYRRCTPSAGTDINFVSRFEITSALHRTDGSWVVEYLDRPGSAQRGLYHWEVFQDRRAAGYYRFAGGEPEQLGPFHWRQPVKLGPCS